MDPMALGEHLVATYDRVIGDPRPREPTPFGDPG